eukprot:TRINITY_DN2326_c0_g2_i1.p1 TRINITY_DN2326_c0_g2~~TRINITY_DN2326_c0_g2_i1.p1  ORF type:complete len:447 (+),score=124.14 TRINITY_DN2326_c0_g2_i1:35-1342(+)
MTEERTERVKEYLEKHDINNIVSNAIDDCIFNSNDKNPYVSLAQSFLNPIDTKLKAIELKKFYLSNFEVYYQLYFIQLFRDNYEFNIGPINIYKSIYIDENFEQKINSINEFLHEQKDQIEGLYNFIFELFDKDKYITQYIYGLLDYPLYISKRLRGQITDENRIRICFPLNNLITSNFPIQITVYLELEPTIDNFERLKAWRDSHKIVSLIDSKEDFEDYYGTITSTFNVDTPHIYLDCYGDYALENKIVEVETKEKDKDKKKKKGISTTNNEGVMTHSVYYKRSDIELFSMEIANKKYKMNVEVDEHNILVFLSFFAGLNNVILLNPFEINDEIIETTIEGLDMDKKEEIQSIINEQAIFTKDSEKIILLNRNEDWVPLKKTIDKKAFIFNAPFMYPLLNLNDKKIVCFIGQNGKPLDIIESELFRLSNEFQL